MNKVILILFASCSCLLLRVGSENLIQNMMCWMLCKHCYLKLT